MRGAVELRNGDDVASQLGDVQHGVIDRCLAAGNAQGLQPAFERGDAALQHRRGRVADAGVAESFDLKIE